MSFLHSRWETRPVHLRARVAPPVVAIVGVLVALLGAVGAGANPSIQEKRAQAQAILEQVQQLDGEVGDASERWNGANYKLGLISDELSSARVDLVRAKKGVKTSQARVGTRLRELYINGDPAGAIEVFLGAKSLQEIVDVLDATSRVTSQDARIARELKSYSEQVAQRKKQLVLARAQQAEVVQQRATERAAIEAKLAERQRLLSSVQAEVQRLVAEEQARQAELRRQAEIRLAQQQAAAAAAQQQAARQAQLNAEALSSEAAAPALDPTALGNSSPSSDPSIPVAPPADASKAAQVVAIAMQYLGVPYVWGAASPSAGFDCSGLTMYVFAQVGVSLPHYAAAQYGMGVPVSRDQLQPGDLVFFRGLGHMGMYIGGGNFIHAPHTGDVVKISSLFEPYYASTWVGARRVL
jgi:cell wall-associated NlpC family hydrolase